MAGADLGGQPEEADEEEDEIFDFGKAKMDFFKQRARQILLGSHPEELEERAYDGNPLPLGVVYSSIKNLIKRPTVTYQHASANEQPHYMKMTFAMSRSVVPHSKVLQLSNMLSSVKKVGKDSQLGSHQLALSQHASNSELTLLKQLKRDGGSSLLGSSMDGSKIKKKTTE